MIALAAKIKTSGTDVAGIAYNVHDWPDDWLYHAMITQAGGDASSTATAGAARRPDIGVKALQRFRRFVTDGGMPLIDWDQSRQQFIAGKIGIFFDTPARLRQVTDLIGDKFTLRTAMFPIDNKAKGGLPTGGNAAIITAQRSERSRRRRGSSSSSSAGPEAQKIVVETTGYMPTNLRAPGPEFLGAVLRQEPELPHRVAADRPLGAVAGLSGRQLGAHLARAARDHHRRHARRDRAEGRLRPAASRKRQR